MPPRRIRRVSNQSWDTYKNIINDFIDNDAGRQKFLWLRKINQPSPFGEDSPIFYEPIQLEGLFQYNFIKAWPNQIERIAGELDEGNQVLYISARLLGKHGFLDQYGYWNYNWSEDRFIVNGKILKPSGDTQVAQAKDEPLLFYVILKREEVENIDTILNTKSFGKVRSFTTFSSKDILDSTGMTIRDVMGNPLIFKP